ncbi:MAG TPA: hypothetical protein VNT75_27760, partial [Symbiobacteriaceae bacterium]|nr:hypothetical protein [Symbiobacteriaceae bacterium]
RIRMACQAAGPGLPILNEIYSDRENNLLEIELAELRLLLSSLTNVVMFFNQALVLLAQVLPGRVIMVDTVPTTGESTLTNFMRLGMELRTAVEAFTGWIQQAQQAPDQEIRIDEITFGRRVIWLMLLGQDCQSLLVQIMPFARQIPPRGVL